jgi:hypothetical protein
MSINEKIIRNYIKNLLLFENSVGKLRIFDFDDTLVQTSCKVVIIDKLSGDVLRKISPAEYGNVEQNPRAILKSNEEYDYSQFADVLDPQEIKWTINILKKVVGGDTSNATILTARGEGAKENINQFLKNIGITGVPIITLGSSDPLDKVKFIYDKLLDGITDIKFFDDSEANVNAAKLLHNELKKQIGLRNPSFFTDDINNKYYDILNHPNAPINTKIYVTKVNIPELTKFC